MFADGNPRRCSTAWIEAMGSTNMSIISVFGSRGAAAAVGGPAAAAGHMIKEQ